MTQEFVSGELGEKWDEVARAYAEYEEAERIVALQLQIRRELYRKLQNGEILISDYRSPTDDDIYADVLAKGKRFDKLSGEYSKAQVKIPVH
jgi:hypothetical protein